MKVSELIKALTGLNAGDKDVRINDGDGAPFDIDSVGLNADVDEVIIQAGDEILDEAEDEDADGEEAE